MANKIITVSSFILAAACFLLITAPGTRAQNVTAGDINKIIQDYEYLIHLYGQMRSDIESKIRFIRRTGQVSIYDPASRNLLNFIKLFGASFKQVGFNLPKDTSPMLRLEKMREFTDSCIDDFKEKKKILEGMKSGGKIGSKTIIAVSPAALVTYKKHYELYLSANKRLYTSSVH